MAQVTTVAQRLHQAVAQQIYGKDLEIDKVLAALLAGGHVLLEDIPGTGKTTLARTLAQALEAKFRRVQFTPDLLPADLIGVSIPDAKTGTFQFHPGPVFTQILLADEINRAAPRTQSALLECMGERQVTADGVTYPLEEPFFVIATQNPVELSGTFPLPEAQLDRFLLCISLGYPEREQELALLERDAAAASKPAPAAVVTAAELLEARQELQQVTVSRAVLEYLADLAAASRNHPQIQLGLSTRGLLALLEVSRAWAAMQGRTYVIPDDIKILAPDCMAHRLMLRGGSWESAQQDSRKLVQELLDTVPVPKEP